MDEHMNSIRSNECHRFLENRSGWSSLDFKWFQKAQHTNWYVSSFGDILNSRLANISGSLLWVEQLP